MTRAATAVHMNTKYEHRKARVPKLIYSTKESRIKGSVDGTMLYCCVLALAEQRIIDRYTGEQRGREERKIDG